MPTFFKLGAFLQLPPKEQTIIRYFITTSSAVREFVRRHASEFDPQLIEAFMKLPFAQFLWIVEFATEAQWATGQISGRAIVDATASLTESYPFWLFHGPRRALVFGRDSVSVDFSNDMGVLEMADMGHAGFTRWDRNLRPTQTK